MRRSSFSAVATTPWSSSRKKPRSTGGASSASRSSRNWRSISAASWPVMCHW